MPSHPDSAFVAPENTERNFVAHNVATRDPLHEWDGSHPPPAGEPETCGCDEAKAWRERALKAEAELVEAIGAIEAAVLGGG